MQVEEKIKEHLKEKGIKRKRVAEALGMSETNFSMMINRNRSMRLDEYLKICEFLEVDAGFFLKEETKNC